MRRTSWRAGVAALVIVVSVLAYDLSVVQVWDGGFDLRVTIEGKGIRTARCVWVEPLHDAARAYECAFGRHTAARHRRVAVKDAGVPVSVGVNSSGRVSGLGRDLRYANERYLLVVAEFPDGHKRLIVAPIPDGRVSRRVTVTVPEGPAQGEIPPFPEGDG